MPLLPPLPSTSEYYPIGGRVSQPSHLKEEARWSGDEEHGRPGKIQNLLGGTKPANERRRSGADLTREGPIRQRCPWLDGTLYE